MHDVTTLCWVALIAAVFAVAFFYSSVGHGGATGYLAALALIGIAPASAKVAVLIANIFVASIAFWRFYKAGHFHSTCVSRQQNPRQPANLQNRSRRGAFGCGLRFAVPFALANG
jgi:hypothetical protein